MASREIRDLSAAMQVYYNKFNDRCRRDVELAKRGVQVILTCTHRPNEEQDKLYAQGRTTPGHVVTNAKAGQSAHNAVTPHGEPAAEAFDVALLVHGKLVWDDNAVWDMVGAHGVAVGLKWYGSPGAKFPEKPHFQNPAWSR